MNQLNDYKPNKKSLYALISLVCLMIFTGIIYTQYQRPEQKSGANDQSQPTQENQAPEQSQTPRDISTPKSQTFYLEGVKELDQKNYADAINYFDQAIAENPKQPLFFSDKSEAQFNLGDKSGAIETLNEGINKNPDSDLLKSKLDVLTKDQFSNPNIDTTKE